MVLVRKWPVFQFFFVGNIGQENVFYDILERKNARLKKQQVQKVENKIGCFVIHLFYIIALKSFWQEFTKLNKLLIIINSNNDINLFIMQPHTKVTSDYCICIMNHYFFKKCGCWWLPGQHKTWKSTNFILYNTKRKRNTQKHYWKAFHLKSPTRRFRQANKKPI